MERDGYGLGDRIATLAWNTARHIEAWYGIMGIGAIYHTLNPRLFPEQIVWIMNHAEDKAVFVDLTFVPLLEKIAGTLSSVERYIVLTDKAHMPQTTLKNAIPYEEWLAQADGNFTWERFDERYTADLADGLGNLVSRSLAMLVKYRDGVVPSSGPTPLDESGGKALEAYTRAMEALDLRGGVEATWELVAAANLFVQQTAPWALAKAGKQDGLDSALSALARALARLAVMVSPFMPGKAQAIWTQLGLEGEVGSQKWSEATQPRVSGHTVRPPEVLFPKPAAV